MCPAWDCRGPLEKTENSVGENFQAQTVSHNNYRGGGSRALAVLAGLGLLPISRATLGGGAFT